MALVFSSKCRPQHCDAVEIAIKNNIIFFGYPVLIKDVAYDPQNLTNCLVDPSLPDPDWKNQAVAPNKQQVANHNLVQDVLATIKNKEGVFGIIPRPDRGLMYVGKVKRFKLNRNPTWAGEYMKTRKKSGLDINDAEDRHIADVAQCFEIDSKFVEVPYHQVPARIIASAMGRSTLGRVRGLEGSQSPYEIVSNLFQEKSLFPSSKTTEVAEIETRLIDWCSPNSFEHLCVHLLQLEYPQMIWRHIGGSGDGGVDGIGGQDNLTTHVLQCKLFGLNVNDFLDRANDKLKLFLATLDVVAKSNFSENLTIWDRNTVARLVQKHAAKLPQANTLLICSAN